MLIVLISSGCVSIPAVSLPTSTRVLDSPAIYLSASGEKLEIISDNRAGAAILKLPDGTMTVLPAESAGLAGLYKNNRMTLWVRENSVLLWVDGSVAFSGSSENFSMPLK